MDIKILGKGCPRCHRLEQLTREVVAELGIDATFDHVTDVNEIVTWGVMGTPALVVDGKVKVSGRVPAKSEIAGWLAAK